MELESGGLDARVERVEIFMLAARPYSSIIYSGSSTEGFDPFCHRMRNYVSHQSIETADGGGFCATKRRETMRLYFLANGSCFAFASSS